MENKDNTTSYDKGGPFGDADASRVDFNKLRRSFVSLTSEEEVSIDDSIDTYVRVIVGRKGAGKTLYLRSIHDHYRRLNYEKEGTVYVTDIGNEPPDTNLIIKITSWFENNNSEADEIWRRIWKIIILRTTYTHLFFSHELVKYTNAKQRNAFIEQYRNILPKATVPTSIFNQLTSFLARFNSGKDLTNHLYLEEWGSLETELNYLIKQAPPIYFFLDQLDDDFTRAPYQWLKCQYGLFTCMFRFIRNNSFGGRLHIIACIREIVYAYVLQTQDGSKYLSESKIKVLRWDIELAKHFLDKKIQLLDDKYFKDTNMSKTVEGFFGLNKVQLKRNNGFEELLHPYILRHTMLMPRDIINIGNIFCEKRQLFSPINMESALKGSVKHVAKQIAQEQTTIASILIINKWIYNGAVENGTYTLYNDESMIRSVSNNLCKLIMKIGKDRFTQKVLNNITNNLKEFEFDESDRPFNALFLAGLLGYIEKDSDKQLKEIFFSESRNTQFSLPMLKKEFVFHSSLIDYLNIKPIGRPVYA